MTSGQAIVVAADVKESQSCLLYHVHSAHHLHTLLPLLSPCCHSPCRLCTAGTAVIRQLPPEAYTTASRRPCAAGGTARVPSLCMLTGCRQSKKSGPHSRVSKAAPACVHEQRLQQGAAACSASWSASSSMRPHPTQHRNPIISHRCRPPAGLPQTARMQLNPACKQSIAVLHSRSTQPLAAGWAAPARGRRGRRGSAAAQRALAS